MKNHLDRIKPRVRELKAYTLKPEITAIKINQNENPWDLPTRIKEETFRRLSTRAWSRYPDFIPVTLHERLAKFSGWKKDGILVGNGSNELIQATLMVTLGEGRRVLISEPTFALYRQVSTVLNGEIISVPLKADLSYDIPALHRAIDTYNPDVTIICSPNNPTGAIVTNEELASLLEISNGIIVIDEAYFDFADNSVVPLLERYPNLVAFRTFSKAMAMAALRVGYLLADPHLTREIGKALLPYNLNAISQTAAEVSIEMYETELDPLVKRIIAERDRLFKELNSIDGLRAVPSRGNFMVVESKIEPKQVCAELLTRGILIRDVSSYPMLENYFRVSVGAPEENDKLVLGLREIFSLLDTD
jgi:histidinol-phosphate aminotransferase